MPLNFLLRLKNNLQQESQSAILEDFLHTHQAADALYGSAAKEIVLPHPKGNSSGAGPTKSYAISQELCQALQGIFRPHFVTQGESEDSWFGVCRHQDTRVGFYLGRSYRLGEHWARFWVEEEPA
jgi:hypothetical protein